MTTLLTLGLLLFIFWDLLVLVLLPPAPPRLFLEPEDEPERMPAKPRIIVADEPSPASVGTC